MHPSAYLPRICRVSAAYLNYLLAKLDPSRLRQLSKDERDNTRTGFFTKEEFESLAAHLPEDLRYFCRFAYLTGMRRGSIASLRWEEQIDPENIDEMNLPGKFTKNGKPLKLSLVGKLGEVIARRLDKSGQGRDAFDAGLSRRREAREAVPPRMDRRVARGGAGKDGLPEVQTRREEPNTSLLVLALPRSDEVRGQNLSRLPALRGA